LKRVKVFEFTLLSVETLLHGAVIDPPLPPDATVSDFHVDWLKNVVQVMVASGTFQEVPEGAMAPIEWVRLRKIRADGSIEP